MDFPYLKPGPGDDAPLYLQLYRRYRDAIASGKLRAGDRVPSVRSLASELNLARGTVELAYQVLTSEGYFSPRGAAGTFVSPHLEPLGETVPISAPALSAQIPVDTQMPAGVPRPFQLGLPALDAFPRKTWVRLAARNLRALDLTSMAYPESAGYFPLRHAIATYLGISRGIACTADQVFVTAGYRAGLDLVCRTLLKPGDEGWFENPGYLFARQFLTASGMRLSPIPVDEEGLEVSHGIHHAANARFAVVTPTHQSPTGATLSLPRRLALLEWANQQKAWIVEDDYDSEFRYHGRPVPALKSLDHDGRVLYTGTFSKVLFPGLRLAYLVVPVTLIDRFTETANLLGGAGPISTQATVAEFMEHGHFARHLRKMRALYAERRGLLVDALNHVFGDDLGVQPQAGGIQTLAYLHDSLGGLTDVSVANAAHELGLAVHALSHWHFHGTPRAGLLMGFANIPDSKTALALCRRLSVAVYAD
ncbi:MocR-like pyridoxine biosynthesis transcription factor PdxR [Pandoraea fibrosis]|uniref:Aminotransferase class I/II-fold pyridoxal phosphate-dependent enzyme n=1 Tax=Pandoraea fibrosis TaxID=1891094 RepID=A0A5E4S3A1_9BURK|nr:PLP-dependent aminotransferase family protein [Pandoraea fibrosis]QHE92598.1 aminotransferase class I/II-fold pyridoxal phosphate-dependent enzyme [Pandoraea fibrosis]QHF13846.1 aminotransferase class I/II-fold pyridoxal phosphate-dependent enzyme [Pandoraea fibrosis]VVD69064.1 DNA-binding protein [Pandoraea fibrosis]